MAPNALFVVEGEIHLVDVSSTIVNATVYVQLLDVSLADAPSKVVAEEVIHDVSFDLDSPSAIPFSVRAPGLDRRGMYTVMVHVDVSGSGDITRGDYITMESFPVSPAVSPVYIPDVKVRLVR